MSEKQKSFFTEEQIDLIKKTCGKGVPENELNVFIMLCKKTGLDPLSRQIYLLDRRKKIPNSDKYETTWTTQISIDGSRLCAQRTGLYAGQRPVQWCGKDGKWVDVWTEKEPPYAARVGILRKDFDEPLYVIAKWDSYAFDFRGQVQPMWKKFPDLMLAKVAEALAFRKAFPQELSGLYSTEEMLNVFDDVVENYLEKNNQKKELIEIINTFDVEQTRENYKWFSDKLIGVKMNELEHKISTLLPEFKSINKE